MLRVGIYATQVGGVLSPNSLNKCLFRLIFLKMNGYGRDWQKIVENGCFSANFIITVRTEANFGI